MRRFLAINSYNQKPVLGVYAYNWAHALVILSQSLTGSIDSLRLSEVE